MGEGTRAQDRLVAALVDPEQEGRHVAAPSRTEDPQRYQQTADVEDEPPPDYTPPRPQPSDYNGEQTEISLSNLAALSLNLSPSSDPALDWLQHPYPPGCRHSVG